jgi:hydrogenase nickel incorporation protein HypA/HybF
MHEYSIVGALIGRVEAEARSRGATSIQRIQVALGELSGVDPDLLATAYETFRAGTLCAGADLDLHTVPARWACPSCGGTVPRGAALRCPSFEIPDRLAAGDEILLERIEMEVT